MDFKKRPLGVIPSKYDPRDYTIARVISERVAESLPAAFQLPLPPDAPYDQNGYGMCVAFAIGEIKQIQEFAERGVWTRYSEGYIYGRREFTDYTGEGMEPRQALANLLNRGVPQHQHFSDMGTFPDLNARLTLDTKNYLDRLAMPQRIGAYVRLNGEYEIKTALMQLGPVLYCIPVFDSFYRGGDLSMPGESETIQGYHALILYGWKDGRWLGLNSWGREWGSLEGKFTVPFGYPVSEVWSITDRKPLDPTVRMQIGSKQYRIGDKVYEMDVAPFIQGDRTFVPLRFIAESLGCAVDWKQDTQEVIVTPNLR